MFKFIGSLFDSNEREIKKLEPLVVLVNDFEKDVKKLSDKKIKTLLVEGGGTINWEFIKHNLFDELIITLSPFLIGGHDAISFVQGQGFEKISNSPNLRLKSIKRLKNYLVLYYVKV